VDDIFFKLSKDTNSHLYGGDQFAVKAASHEFKSLLAVRRCALPELHTGIMCLLDYFGYRLTACAVLPVGSSTLCYGSADAGRTVFGGSMVLPPTNAPKYAALRRAASAERGGLKGKASHLIQAKFYCCVCLYLCHPVFFVRGAGYE
jgi:hypothetical protein